MLITELIVELALKLGERRVLLAGDGAGGRLVSRRVDFDLVPERVVVDVICDGKE